MNKKGMLYSLAVASVFLGLTIMAWVKPIEEFSVTERRPLEQFPDMTVESLMNGNFMGNFEEYTIDQFPLRDEFRSIKAWVHTKVMQQKDNNDVYMADGYISKLDATLSTKAMDNAIRKYQSIYERYLAGTQVNVYHSIIPDKNYFLAKENGYLSYDYAWMFQYMEQKLENMTYIDIVDLLSIEDYYRTDTHWRQEAITDVANRLAQTMGVSLNEKYEEVTLETPFYGVYYGQYAMPIKPDTIKYLTSETFDDCIITNHEKQTTMTMYDMEKAIGRDPYEMFLSGSISVITIENPNATTEKELVIFRDSFGSSLAPLFVEGYQKITILDVRYLNEMMIEKFVTFDKQDVLFIHSTGVINNEIAFK